jgi:hypothetical protein
MLEENFIGTVVGRCMGVTYFAALFRVPEQSFITVRHI